MKEKLALLKSGEISTPSVDKLRVFYERITKKYPTAVIAGGSISDCIYDKEFYDLDVFVYGPDVDEKYANVKSKSGNGIIEVITTKINGEKMDVVIIDEPIEQQVKKFDLGIKKCWYDGAFHFTDECEYDVINNTLTLVNITGDKCFFRYDRSIKKYGLDCQPIYYEIMNYLVWRIDNNKTVYISDKYKKDLARFKAFAKYYACDPELAKETQKRVWAFKNK